MRRKKKAVRHATALSALVCGLAGCSASSTDDDAKVNSGSGGDPVEAAIGELGVPIAGCDAATAAGGAGFASGVLTLNVGADPLVLSAPGGRFAANGIGCTYVSPMSTPAKPLKTDAVTSIIIKGSAADNKVIFDFLPGTFGTKVFLPTGGIFIDFSTASSASPPVAGNDSVMLRGGTTSDTYKFAQGSITTASVTRAGDVFIEITGDKAADIDIKLPAMGATGTFGLAASMGGGNDSVQAYATTTDFNTFGVPLAASGNLSALAILPKTINITAYGGLGDDKFVGGLGNDTFSGGKGADTFKMNSVSDGADTYIGDEDLDTVDYSNHSGNPPPMSPSTPVVYNDLAVDIGPIRAGLEGQIDLSSPSLYGAAGTLAGRKLALVIDNKRVETTAFATPAKPKDVVDAINTAVTAAMVSPAPKVFLTARNHLAIVSGNTTTTGANVRVEGDPAIATAVGDAEPLLLMSATTGTTPAGLATLTGPSLATFPTLTTERLVLLINGRYVVVTLASETTAQTVADNINAAINSAFGSPATPVVYATVDATPALVITAASIAVKPATAAYTFNSAAAALGFSSSIEGTVTLPATATTLTALITPLTAPAVLPLVLNNVLVEVTVTAATTDLTLVSSINTAANTALGTSGVVYASVTPTTNHLVINANSAKVLDTAAIATATSAHTLLGLTLTAGTPAAIITGNVSLATSGLYGASGSLMSKKLLLTVNGEYVTVDFATGPADATALLTAINGAINTALGTNAVVYATQEATSHFLTLRGISMNVLDASVATAYTSVKTAFGLGTYGAPFANTVADADDGLAGEHDDVRYTVENIISGGGNDTLIGSDLKNSIKAGDGNDFISGGASTACGATDGDTLLGEGGNDTFYMPQFNCKAVLTGGDGDNVADFSGRSLALVLKNNGTADDGETTPTAEVVNIGTDIKKLVGGYGNDVITGGSGDEIFVGGAGNDTITGGMGNDTMDYSGSPAGVTVTLCFTAPAAVSGVVPPGGGCAAGANDGVTAGAWTETDDVYQVEHVIGSPFNDILGDMATSATLAVELTIEGGAGDDIIWGGTVNDTLWGDSGNDTLHGGDGDDNLSGDAGDDALDGGASSGDICLSDAADVTTAQVECESI